MTSLQEHSKKVSLIGTSAFWLIFFVCMLIIKPSVKKPKFKEVQIVLDSTPVQKKIAEAPAPAAPAPAPAPSEAPAEAKKTPAEPKKNTAEPKKTVAEPKKTTSDPKKATEQPKKAPAKTPAPQKLEKSVDDLMNEQFAKKQTKPAKDFDWSMFDDDAPVSPQPEQRTVTNDEPAFSGSAATAAAQPTQKISSEQKNLQSKSDTTSKSTSEALGKIANTKFHGKANSTIDTESTVDAKRSGNGKVQMQTSTGLRTLIEPSEPVINLSEAAAATIDGSRTVSIEFKVVQSGNVPRTDVKITPESILSDIVKSEVIEQISKWRFEAADFISIAKFEYKIVKK